MENSVRGKDDRIRREDVFTVKVLIDRLEWLQNVEKHNAKIQNVEKHNAKIQNVEWNKTSNVAKLWNYKMSKVTNYQKFKMLNLKKILTVKVLNKKK